MEILKVEHLVKKYGKGDSEVTAVNDVSFSVNQGEFVAIVGSIRKWKVYTSAPVRWCRQTDIGKSIYTGRRYIQP